VIRVRTATPDDLHRTADWHCDQLRLGLFPRLGPRFVRHWHATYLTSPHGVALIAEADAADAARPGRFEPVAFLLGSTCATAHTQHVVLRHRVALGFTGVVALLRRPTVARDFTTTRARRYWKRLRDPVARTVPTSPGADAAGDAVSPAGPARPRVAVLTAVVVDPAHHGSGAGSAVVQEFLARAALAGSTRAELVTSAEGGAGGFYERIGWQACGRTFSGDGDPLLRFSLDLSQATRARNGRRR
jgi:GNAT superfamily N-acetyltransferase